MFEYLKIKNHQSHRDSFLEFVKGVNVIIGTSLHGKTSIARAINLISENRPSGTKYYSNFAPDKGCTMIELKTDDNIPVVLKKLVKRKSDGSKILGNTNYEFGSKSFDHVDKAVPDEIIKALNLSELNIQRQFEQPFLILSSAGEVSRVINRITKLDKVDEWVSELKKRSNRRKNEISLLEEQTKSNEAELARYAGFEDLSESIKELESKSAEFEKLNNECIKLDGLLTKLEANKKEIDRLSPVLSIQKTVDKAEELDGKISSYQKQINLIKRAKEIDSKILIGKQIVSLYDKLQKIIEIESEADRLDSYLGKIEAIDKSKESLSKEYEKIKKQYLDGLGKTKECPIFSMPCPSVKEMTDKITKTLN